MRFLSASILVAAITTTACGSSSPTPTSPTVPAASATVSGTWAGSTSDSSGSMMGAGMTTSMMGGMTWQVTQSGTTFSGTMQFPGYGGGSMMVSGTMNGKTGTFTMTMPTGSMMNSGSMMMGGCNATATGTFDMDDMMTQMTGSYAGTNSCAGPFNNGKMTLAKR